MTKINHRENSTCRRTPQAYEAAAKSEMAYLDAMVHIACENHRHRNQHHRLCYGRHTTLAQFVYELPAKRNSRNGGSR